jgi:transcriptional regulator with XRE-family HTH domain
LAHIVGAVLIYRRHETKSKNICGATIRKLRLKAGLTQLELSRKLSDNNIKIDRAGIAKIETGARCVLDYELVRFAKALKVGVEKIVKAR